MVAKSHSFELKTSIGLTCNSPKVTVKKAAKRENRPLMCGSGEKASPKDGVAGVVLEQQNPQFYIPGALDREKLCNCLFGGGGGNSNPRPEKCQQRHL